MNTLFSLIQKTLLATVALSFAFVTLYTPQLKVVKVENAEATAKALEVTQWVNRTLLTTSNVLQTAMSTFLSSLNVKEYILDPIAWVAAKGIIASATNSIVSWVNSGFKGAPMFVQDMKSYLQNINVNLTTEFVDELTYAPYVTGPFRGDIQDAFSNAFADLITTEAPRGVSVYDNTFDQKLIALTDGKFGADSWDDWFKVVNNPQTYTPYGNLMAVQRESERRVAEAQTNEKNLLNFGDGFISNKVCSILTKPQGNKKESCNVMTPGQTISESLNLHLGSGINSLITADEISEILAQLVVNLGVQAISGAAGLLGLSNNTGYTDTSITGTGNSAVDQMIIDQNATMASSSQEVKNLVNKDLAVENKYEIVATDAKNAYIALGESPTAINSVLSEITTNKNSLQNVNDSLDNGADPGQAMNDYNTIPKHDEADIKDNSENWVFNLQNAIASNYKKLSTYSTKLTFLKNQLNSIVTNPLASQANKNAANTAIAEINAEQAKIDPALSKLDYDPDNPSASGGLAAGYMNGSLTAAQVLSGIAAINYNPSQSEINSNIANWTNVYNANR